MNEVVEKFLLMLAKRKMVTIDNKKGIIDCRDFCQKLKEQRLKELENSEAKNE